MPTIWLWAGFRWLCAASHPYFYFLLCRGRDAGCPAPPHRSRRAVFPHRALRAGTSSSLTGRLARLIRRSHGTGCLCGLRQHVGPFSSFGADALPLDTMSRSDSRSARRRFWSLRRPSCLALAISAAGTLRVSSVPCVCFRARHALRPRQAFHALTVPGVSVLGSGQQTPSPLAAHAFPWVRFSTVVRPGGAKAPLVLLPPSNPRSWAVG